MGSKIYWTILAGLWLTALTASQSWAWQSNESKPAESSKEQSGRPVAPSDARMDSGSKLNAKTATQDKDLAATYKPLPVVDPNYVIGTEDILMVNVWREPGMSRPVSVRPDGKITLPWLGDFEADGVTTKKLEEAITTKLQSLVSNPEVSVIVLEIRSQ